MQTRLQQVRRGVVASCAAVLLGLSALGVTTVAAAGPQGTACSVGLLGVCVVSASPTPSVGATLASPAALRANTASAAAATPTATPTPPPQPTAAAVQTTAPRTTATPAAGGSTGGGLLGGLLGGSATPKPSSSSDPSASSSGCVLNLLGNCLTLLPGQAQGSQGIVVSLPASPSPQPVLGLGQTGCIAAIVGSCVIGSTPTSNQPCLASLLSLCVGNAPANSQPTCLVNGLVCANTPCLASPCPTSTPQPSAQGAARPSQSSGPTSQATNVAAGGAPSAPGGGSPSVGTPSVTSSGQSRAQPQVGSIPSAVTAQGALGAFAGLQLGSLLIWPIFAVLDIIAAAFLITLARRSQSAAPGD